MIPRSPGLLRRPRRPSRGFTLIETIIAMVVMGIAAAGLIAMQGRMFNGISTVKDMQVDSRLMLECAEQVLARRRFAEDGFSAVVAANGFGANQCGGLPALSGFTVPSVSITEPFTGAACPSGYSCKTVTISQGGLAAMTLLLVDY
jgi:prepilin-type N-terminal cleavage/methylation domain-containing protein